MSTGRVSEMDGGRGERDGGVVGGGEPRGARAPCRRSHDPGRPAQGPDATRTGRGSGGRIRVCVAGTTGWTGRAVAEAVWAAPDLHLVAALARSSAGRDLGELLGRPEPIGVTVAADPAQALAAAPDVWIDYTHPAAVKGHALAALAAGTRVVIGTSGLTGADHREIERAALEADSGVIAAGNFSLTAALLKHLAGIAARHLPHREIIDYAHAHKPDAPSGTALELAGYLDSVAPNETPHPVEETLGFPATRGATIGGTQVHAVRLPSYLISVEAIFGLPDERLTLRHDAGTSPAPYVAGTLLAARRVGGVMGLVRGLDRLLFGGEPVFGGEQGATP